MANGELTLEEIDEIIAEQQFAPRMQPPVAPPSMQFVTGRPPVMDAPPVPLPLGTERRFFAQPPAPQNPLEDIRKQINAVQFKTAQEALDAATQFQALRAYQRDLEAGKDPTRWLPLLFKKNPTVIPAMMRERRLGAAPTVFQGSNVPPAVVYGGRVAFPPASSMVKPPPESVKGIPIILPDGTEDPDNYAAPSHTGRGFTIHSKKPKVTGPSISARQSFYKSKIEDIDTALRKLDFAEPPPPDAEAQRTALKNQRATFQKEWDDMMQPKGKAASAPAARSEPKKLTKELARQFLTEAGGDKEKARKLAKDRGYEQ